MTNASVAADFDHSLNIHRNFSAKITFYGEVFVDVITQQTDFGFGQVLHASIGIDAGFSEDDFRSVEKEITCFGFNHNIVIDLGNTCFCIAYIS